MASSRYKEAKVVSIIDMVPTKTSEHDVQLPSAEEMATYDTLEVDLGQYCKDHKSQNCFEWDTGVNLYVVETPAVEPDPVVGQPCAGTATQVCECITPRQQQVARSRACKAAKDGKFGGKDYVPEKAPAGQYNPGGFGAQIDMESWLLIYE